MAFHIPTLDFLRRRKRAYQVVLSHDTAEHRLLLSDLAKFCRAFDSCYVPGDHDATLALLGRQEVWLRIREHLDLPPEELYRRYGGVNVKDEKAQ